jgi:hypothetical protein
MEGDSMFGIGDVQIQVAYAMAIGLAILCVAYGVVMWNKEDD